MSYMKRDYGSEHDRGGLFLDGNGQPNEPAPRCESGKPKVPPMPLMGPSSAGPVKPLYQQDVVRNSAPALGDRPGNTFLSPSVDPSAVGYSGSLKGPDSATHARQPDPRQHIFEALCDDPSLTREDALELLAIRDEALANDAATQIWSRQRIVESVRRPDAARELMQRSPLNTSTGKDSIQANFKFSSVNVLPRSSTSPSAISLFTSMSVSAQQDVAEDSSTKTSYVRCGPNRSCRQ